VGNGDHQPVLTTCALPGDFAGAGSLVGHTRQHEEQVGQPIEIDHDEVRQFDVAGQMHHAPLGATAHSPRDVQRRHGGQYFKGKGLDGSCPMGPHIVTADEVKSLVLTLAVFIQECYTHVWATKTSIDQAETVAECEQAIITLNLF
jgi:hypothetical protein